MANVSGELWTVNNLANEFGMAAKTMKKRIENLEPAQVDHNGYKYYTIKDVFNYILEIENGHVSPAQAAALLNESRREKLQLETSILEGKHVLIEEVMDMIVEPVMNAKNKILSLKSKLSPLVPTIETAEEAEKVIDGFVTDILVELSNGSMEGSMVTTTETESE